MENGINWVDVLVPIGMLIGFGICVVAIVLAAKSSGTVFQETKTTDKKCSNCCDDKS